MMSSTQRSKIRKSPKRAVFDEQKLFEIIDESLLAHIAIIEEHGPIVIPMLAWRCDRHVYIHGASNSRLLRELKQGKPTCLTFSLFDGWVLARSAFHHSAHYRSAVVFGEFEEVRDEHEKNQKMNHFIEQIAPGRSMQTRAGNRQELAATMLLKMPLNEASVKISNGEVNDEKADMDRAVWAGFLPYQTKVGPLQPAADLADGIATPDYSSAYLERWYK